MSRAGFFLFFTAFTTLFFAQNPTAGPLQTTALPAAKPTETKPAENKNEDGKEAFIIEQSLTSETYEADGTGVWEGSFRVRVQSQAGVQRFGLINLSYEKNFQNAEFTYVRVRKSDGSVINTPLDQAQDIEAEITRSAPFYSDLREKHIAVKGLAVGDVVEWQTVIRIVKALAPGHFWSGYSFEKGAVDLDEEVRLSVPKDLYVKVKSPKFEPKVHDEGTRRIYEWKHIQLEAQEEDPKIKFGPPFRQPQADIQVSSFKSWDDVGRWYGELQRDRVIPSAEVKTKALELTKDAKTDDDKMRALYDFVATNFRYIGVAFGIGRYQPHSAGDVLENSYGDCKDKHTLLAAMLQAVGIEASPAIISSVHQVDRDVPSPAQFDHVITAVHRGKDLVWLDTTTEVAPFGMLLANLRDKDALLISSDGSASWVKTPQNPPYELFDNFRAEASLSEAGEMKAEMQDEVRSDGEVALRGAFHYVAQPQWKDLMQRISYGMGYAGTVSDVTADPPEKTAGPFHFTYKYDRTDLEEWINNKRILMPSPPMGVPDLNNEYEKSGEPVRLGTPIKLDYISDVKFPAGYSVQLPQNVDVVTDFAEYHSQYSLKDGQIHSERKLIVLAKEVPATQYAKYRDFVHKVSDDYGTWITLTSSSGGSTSSSESASPAFNWPPIPDNDAGHEMRDGISLLQNRNVPEGLAKLEEAAQRDPKLPGVWDMIASAHFMKGDVEGALDNMRRQTTETPDLAIAFKALATTLLRLQKNAEAVPVARRWMELAPEDRDALTNYGSALMASKQYSQVVDLYEKAVKQDPHRTAYQFRLATAYLELGQNERALQGYRDAIDTALTKDEPENDAAYNLAEKNLNLDQAEEWAKNAVRETEQQTQNLSLDKLESRNLRLMDQLSAYWDTLGWVYFRKGEYTKAEPYLRSSWWLRQSSVVGEHLAQVYEKLHQSIQASRFRQLAEVTPDRRGQVLTPEQAMQAMKTFKSTWKGGEWDARGELGKMRTFHVPVTGKSSESAEFFVLLSAGGANPITGATPGTSTTRSAAPTSKPEIAAVKFISGASSLRKAESGLEHADLALRLPANTNVKLLRRGILMCSPYTNGCDFTLMTVESVRSLN